MGGPNSGRWGGRPTVEACGSIVLDLSKMLALRDGLDAFGLVYSGTLGSSYKITVMVQLGPEDGGKLTNLALSIQPPVRTRAGGLLHGRAAGRALAFRWPAVVHDLPAIRVACVQALSAERSASVRLSRNLGPGLPVATA